jgi:hypothetical protein
VFPFPTGIFVQGHKNVVIRNCTISHRAQTTWPFGNGIYFTGADNLSITDVAVELVRTSFRKTDFPMFVPSLSWQIDHF